MLAQALGEDLLGLAVHGSWVAGDFQPERSDLDLVALLASDPDDRTLVVLREVHEELALEAPLWRDRIEVDYISPTAVHDVVNEVGAMHSMARISPGEPIHLVEMTDHYLLNWHSARAHNRAIVGATPRDLLPAIPESAVRAVVFDHVKHWPEWVVHADAPGPQAYAVLTMCRAQSLLQTGEQVSKRAAAIRAQVTVPQWAALIAWASDWWFEGGPDSDDRHSDVIAFVSSLAGDLLIRASEGD